MPIPITSTSIGGAAGGGGGGLTSIPTGKTIWVDAVNGNDGTALAGRQDRPFLTVAAALAVAASGDLVRLRPGTYAESGLTIPAGVHVWGDGWTVTTLGAAGALADILTMGADCAVQGLTIACPSGAGLAGLTHTTGTGSVVAINLAGDGLVGTGYGISKTGTGKLIGGNIRNETGGLAAVFRVSSGVLALDDTHIPQSAGTTAIGILAEGAGTYQGQGFNCGNTNVADAIQLADTAVCRIYSPNIFNVANAVHITADGPTFTVVSGAIAATLRTVWVDPLLTGTGTTVRALSTVIDPLFDFPPAAAQNTEFVLSFNQRESTTRDSRQRIIGADLALGFPELGTAFSAGKGAPYGDGIQVVTTDGTETMVGSVVTGGNQTDVTAEAQSRSASTYTFQGTGTGNAIYFASTRKDGASVPLKHWGHILNQVAAGVGGSYAFEIWDGAAWAEIGVMAVSTAQEYRYANEVFLRASNEEELFFGVVGSTNWAQSTVNGVAGYHVRVRVATVLTTAPTFERARLCESAAAFNRTGQRIARGLAKWKLVVGAVGFRPSGSGVANGVVTMGTGAVTWAHELDQALLNSTGDDAYLTLGLPQGICTAHPIRLKLLYGYQAFNNPPTIQIDFKANEVEGNLVADPAGGITPVARTLADTEATDAVEGTRVSFAGLTMPVNKVTRHVIEGIDVSSFYEDDFLAVRVTNLNDGGGGGTDILIYGIEIEGLQFTDGAVET